MRIGNPEQISINNNKAEQTESSKGKNELKQKKNE
jgi:hypothetical protein